MKLYMVRAWVNKWHRNGGYSHPFKLDEVFTKLPRAKEVYDSCVAEIKTWEDLSDIHSVQAMLFVPHIFDNGALAYWPDNEKYIKRYNLSIS